MATLKSNALLAATSWALNYDKMDFDGLTHVNNIKFHSIYQEHPGGTFYLHQQRARIYTIGVAIRSHILWIDRMIGGTGA